jgi:hypothetical protein
MRAVRYRRPGVSILPFVLECVRTPRHMLPYGKKDRPILATFSLAAWGGQRIKENRDLVPFNFPGDGL